MLRGVVVVALALGCRGDRTQRIVRDDAGSSAVFVSVVPRLPASADGRRELRELDQQIATWRSQPLQVGSLIESLLQRATIRGALVDYEDVLALSTRWVADAPSDPAAWKTRVTVLGRVHRFAEARAALATWKQLVTDASEYDGMVAVLDEATGNLKASAPYRERLAKQWRHTSTLTQWAASLALTGHLDEAILLIPQAAAELRDTRATTVAGLLFQWGLLYEQNGELAAARRFYEDAHARLPGLLDATVHLAHVMAATGADPRELVTAAVADNPHPELLARAGQISAARAGWERYLKALPEAFSDHAARFFLGAGDDPARALRLARDNLANRDTHQARALAVEAALAANDVAAACAMIDPLRTAPRPQQFLAWRTLSACGRTAEADELGRSLGIR